MKRRKIGKKASFIEEGRPGWVLLLPSFYPFFRSSLFRFFLSLFSVLFYFNATAALATVITLNKVLIIIIIIIIIGNFKKK